MAPLLTLLCILFFILGNAWMPFVKPLFLLLAASFVSWFYFLFGMPIILIILTWKYKQTRRLTTSLVSSVVMILAFYASAILTWILISHGWELSFLTTLETAGASLPGPDRLTVPTSDGGRLDHAAESLLACLLIVSTLGTIAAGVLTVVVRNFWIRRHRVAA